MCTIINLETGMPTVEQAKRRLDVALQTAGRGRVVKIIHGYGSSGKGGAIRREIRAELARKKRSGAVKVFVPGEEFSPFNAVAREMLQKHPDLGRDRDFSRGNAGITMVLL